MLPAFTLPYYEGFNRAGEQIWLGIWRRDERFSVALLQELCRGCLQTRGGQLCTTPWKSLVIKGIAPADHRLWDAVLGRHRLNVRHAANELNWQVEDGRPAGLALKHELVRYFNEGDVRTYQLCFAIKTQPQTGLFGSVVVRRQAGRGRAVRDSAHPGLQPQLPRLRPVSATGGARPAGVVPGRALPPILRSGRGRRRRCPVCRISTGEYRGC